MPDRRTVFSYSASLSPFPEGWYFIATIQEIRKIGLIHKTWMGERIVVWCDESGEVCVAEAYCAHLGSDLGPAAGGRVCAGRLVCPFHGFEYDTTGQCVATPNSDPPRAARIRVFETRKIGDLVFAWWGIDGRGPQWDLPADSLEQDGWSAIRVRTMRFPGHPQETSENSVDLAHLRYVHGYENVNRVGSVLVNGPRMESRFDFKSVRKIAKVARLTLDLSASTVIYGLGYSFVEIKEHTVPMHLRLWVLATPVDGVLIDLSLASQVGEIRRPKRWVAGLGFLPVGLRARILSKFIAAFQYRDVEQDVVIWSHKRYVQRPRLSRSDGEIMPFRAYCAQFYPVESVSENPVPFVAGGAER